MIFSTRPLLRLSAPLALACALSGPAHAQAAVKLEGTCEKLVIAGLDASVHCKGVLMNVVSRNRTSFDFAAWDGQTLSFTGSGAQQERTEETDPLQPINLVTPGKSGESGVVRTPTVAVGACKFSTPAPARTAITCEATTPDNRVYAATFVTDTKPTPDAPQR
ncbi:hypothetical protein [Methylobacterium trifolii]|uniref:Uncharacterized protein n=1 Tax=Methylobacterium trifolii TaxID=1003092 RepID=A0ABQ4U6Z0_9HYPH|nr:hypothetical protein [Methylobacterium trifolii]GJE62637.1 hypothetical protein MPOCJGCO_4770 [Methylobacterium trifolii]